MLSVIYRTKANIFYTSLHKVIFENIIIDTYNKYNGNFIDKINEQKEYIKNLCFNKNINFDVSLSNLFIEITFG